MNKIEGKPKTLKELLQNTKYTIHYYQREYMWQEKHIGELIEDITSEFLEYYKDVHTRQDVANYGGYFMGSIVLAGRENAIIDGQQRLSSLTLLLIYLNNKLKEINETHDSIPFMIFSQSFGIKSFNINIDERKECMEAIFNNKEFDTINSNESVKNLYKGYQYISDIFPDDITEKNLLHFCDWLIEKLFFIEIVASTEQDAHKIFISMNDRGLSLTSTEMLKGYILSEIKDDKEREELNLKWKEKILSLKENDNKEDETFIKVWLRSQYADTIRQGKSGAENKDFEIIGGEFHKWVRDEKDKLGLKISKDYKDFIEKFLYFADIYKTIKNYECTYNKKYKYIFYNDKLDFTFQMQLLLASICYKDDMQTVSQKIILVSKFIEFYILSRTLNYSRVTYNTIKYTIFNITKNIRNSNSNINVLKNTLKIEYKTLKLNISETLNNLYLNNFNKKYLKHFLAHIISFIEEKISQPENYVNYMNNETKNPYEIEHIISNHYEWFKNEYSSKEEFENYRNKIGALLLLPKSINASLNDSNYEEKIKKYSQENIYASSLNIITYKNNPQFKQFQNEYNINFEHYSKFGKIEIEKRTKLLIKLFNIIWNKNMFS
ncbi:DUF262 domain-containing protein [Brachyspira murdochii]|uniref:DUF262 domain-containing protein n=2 Tax=Brachyspira murdochii TaxID=84378 RepID=D5U5N7_BRAM5|nr:DUF262 domain-containing protein [Brachyspira murdochii]ADG72514.1 protein of unknown function DUF262 [Brachyspira murdochii DSM 12563]